jgi:hypothetical protein
MTDLKFAHYFYPGVTDLDRMTREREKIQGCADRSAQHYAEILRDMDAEIAALQEKDGKTDVQISETPQNGLPARSEDNSMAALYDN